MSSNNIPLKLLRGYKDNLPTTIEDGMIYYCIDSNELFFDYVNNSTTPPTEHRYCLNPMVGETDYGDPVGKGLVSPEDKEIIDTAVRFVEQHLEPEQQKQARLNIDAVGEKTLEGGEIFNDYGNNIAFNYAHAEGQMNAATGENSHAEGHNTTAAGLSAHSEGKGLGYTTLSSAATAGSNTFTVSNLNNFEIGKHIVLNNETKKITAIDSSTMTVTVDSNFEKYSPEGTFVYLSGAIGNYSHTEGNCTIATGDYSHAEGSITEAIGHGSHAEGKNTKASGVATHAEGQGTEASGGGHAEGYSTLASGMGAHAEGQSTEAIGGFASPSHAEGFSTKAQKGGHAEGNATQAMGRFSHVEGYKSETIGEYSHAEGNSTKASGLESHAEGFKTSAIGDDSHAEGFKTKAIGPHSHAEGGSEIIAAGTASHAEGTGELKTTTSDNIPGDSIISLDSIEDIVVNQYLVICDTTQNNVYETTCIKEIDINNKLITLSLPLINSYPTGSAIYCYGAIGMNSHSEGHKTTASSDGSHAEGWMTKANGLYSHSEGDHTIADQRSAHAEGSETKALNIADHAEGTHTKASGSSSHAEGQQTEAIGPASHAEGLATEASGNYSHAEGLWTHARNDAAHAEGRNTFAEGLYSHAEGRDATAAGDYSHAEGLGTQALSGIQHVQGKWNIPDSETKYLHIVGNGSTQYARSNAHTLDWEGNAWFAGKVFVGGTSMEDATELEAAKPYMTKITLTASGWDPTALTQVATIEGIKADETAQAIYINPIYNDTIIDEIGNCNVYASAQGENSITFSCDSIPTIDVEFYVKWQDVKWIKPILPPPNLIDFEYNYDETNDTYTLTSWKGTTNGVSGTEILVPNDERIII